MINMIIIRLSQSWSIYSLFTNCIFMFVNKNFVSSHNVPSEPRRDPSNRRLNEYICFLLIVVSMLIHTFRMITCSIGIHEQEIDLSLN